MVKKIIMVMALVMGMGMGIVREVKADCVGKEKVRDYVTGIITEVGPRTIGAGTTVCDIRSSNGSVSSKYNPYVFTVLVCPEGSSTLVEVKDFLGVRKECGACIENSDGTVTCNQGTYCKTPKGDSINDGVLACVDSKSYGVCDEVTGTFKNIQSCPEGTYCEEKTVDYYTAYKCSSSSCEKYDVTIPEGEKRCAGGDVWTCTAGQPSMVDDCDGSQCINDDVYGWVCTGTDSYNVNTCGQIDSGNGGKTSTGNTVALAGRSVCYNDRIYTCGDNLPTFDAGDDCTKNTTNGKTSCCTTLVGGVQGAKCDTAANCDPTTNSEVTSFGTTDNLSDTVESKTSIYNPLCPDGKSISTAFGCIAYDAPGFAAKILQLIFGIAGGIAFLLMVYGFILVATSSGDEKKLQAAKETITSAITGLLVCIFALLLFRLIVVNILQIPGIS